MVRHLVVSTVELMVRHLVVSTVELTVTCSDVFQETSFTGSRPVTSKTSSSSSTTAAARTTVTTTHHPHQPLSPWQVGALPKKERKVTLTTEL
ncbi:hypothetical protein ACOMHN_003201 [Nucella lapillus]